MNIKRTGILFCICGPAGAGKTTIASYLIQNLPPCTFSVSVTSREPRPGEVEGKSYYFVDKKDFESKISKDEFFEYEEVHGNYYGTLKSSVNDALNNGQDLLLDIDIKGALNFKKKLPLNTVILFVTPPNRSILKERLLARGKMSKDELAKRMKTAQAEFDTLVKLSDQQQIDYFMVNNVLEDTLRATASILIAERLRLLRLNVEDLKEICND